MSSKYYVKIKIQNINKNIKYRYVIKITNRSTSNRGKHERFSGDFVISNNAGISKKHYLNSEKGSDKSTVMYMIYANDTMIKKFEAKPYHISENLVKNFTLKTQTYKTAKTPKNNQIAKKKNYVGAGFYIVKQRIYKNKLLPRLLNGASENHINYVKKINTHVSGAFVHPGQCIIMALPPEDGGDPKQLKELQQTAREIDQVRKSFKKEDQQSLIDTLEQLLINGALIDSTGYASAGLGAYATVAEKNYKTLLSWLTEYEKLHVDHANLYAKSEVLGKANNAYFHAKRAEISRRMDKVLNNLTRKKLNLPKNNKVNQIMRISTKSIIHQAKEANGKLSGIKGFATRYKMAAKHLRFIKKAGHFGTAISIIETGLKIYEVCQTKTAEECEEAKYSDGASLAVGLSVGALTGWSTYQLCNAMFAVESGGTSLIFCAIPAAFVSYYAGEKSGEGAKIIGSYVYKNYIEKKAVNDYGEGELYK